MEIRYMAVLVTLTDEQRFEAVQQTRQGSVRAAVWSRAAERLQRMLGRTCSQFNPAVRAWDIEPLPPYGVILGAVEPVEFFRCYGRAGMAQEKELDKRNQVVRNKGEKIASMKIAEGIEVSALAVPKDDHDVDCFVSLAGDFFRGDISAGAGIYFLEQNANIVDNDCERQILANLSRYALCVAELAPLGV